MVVPDVAHAHGIGGRLDLPVPLSYFLLGAGIVLVLSFVALAVLWPRPRLQDGPQYAPLMPVGRRYPVVTILGVLGLALVIGQMVSLVYAVDIDGTRPTIAPVMVWVVFWLVVPFAGAVIGDWYTDLNPWRTLAQWARLGRRERPPALKQVGVWPASVVFLAFVWFELVYPSSGSALTLGIAALVYTVLLLLVISWFGRETALAAFDMFTPYNRLISAISPLGRNETGKIVWRGWLRSLPVIPEWPGLAFFAIVAIGTVSFDGASSTSWYSSIFGEFGATTLGSTLLLLGTVAVVGAAYAAASWLAARLGGSGWTAGVVATRFAHTLVPIALAYAVAHYLTLILFEGQQLVAALSDPFGLGWDLFGTADRRIDFFITATEPIWYAQVAVIVVGHILGVVLAHDRALADFGVDAVRSQYAMLLLMVALTTLGLMILAG